jgi:hypothetical protein
MQGQKFSDCTKACALYPECIGFNKKGGFCYLLGGSLGDDEPAYVFWRPQLLPHNSILTLDFSRVQAGVMIEDGGPDRYPTVTGDCSTPIDCRNGDPHNQCNYVVDGQRFVVMCFMDHPGGDMGVQQTRTLQDCIDLCGDTQSCTDVTFQQGNCYLKSMAGQSFYDTSSHGMLRDVLLLLEGKGGANR